MLEPGKRPFVCLLIGLCLQVAAGLEAAAQGTRWTHQAGGFAVTFPLGWERSGMEGVRQYSPSTQSALQGSFHRRAAGGVFRRRYLSAQTYSLGAISGNASLKEVVDALAVRMGQSYQIIGRYEVPGQHIYLTTFRFRHSGDPVTQCAICLHSPLSSDSSSRCPVTSRKNASPFPPAKTIAH